MERTLRLVTLSLLLWTATPALATTLQGAGTCEVRCDKSRLDCEHRRGPKGLCIRQFQDCQQGCLKTQAGRAPVPEPLLPTASELAVGKAACVRRCDHSRQLCEGGNAQSPYLCASAQTDCVKLCQ